MFKIISKSYKTEEKSIKGLGQYDLPKIAEIFDIEIQNIWFIKNSLYDSTRKEFMARVIMQKEQNNYHFVALVNEQYVKDRGLKLLERVEWDTDDNGTMVAQL